MPSEDVVFAWCLVVGFSKYLLVGRGGPRNDIHPTSIRQIIRR